MKPPTAKRQEQGQMAALAMMTSWEDTSARLVTKQLAGWPFPGYRGLHERLEHRKETEPANSHSGCINRGLAEDSC